MKQIKAIVIGAGPRGLHVYSSYALQNPDEIKIVGVAEPLEDRRKKVQLEHNIPDEYCVSSWEELLDKPNFADVAFICTPDKLHFEPAMKALDQGYHLLLEKPIAPTAEECIQIRDKAKEKNLHAVVCHVLRYTNLFRTLKEIVDTGRIGKLISMTHCENVYHIHHSHSYVRGNWNKLADSAPMILAKSCHDMDLIQWLCGEECREVSSFGSLTYFCPDNAPDDAPAYCMDGCPHLHTCTYSAPRIYAKEKLWGTDYFSPRPTTTEETLEYLKTSPYGKCVFRAGNDVVDHQVVNLSYQSGLTVSFTMCAFTQDSSRTMRIMGTHGELRILFGNTHVIEVYDFRTGRKDVIHTSQNASGHGGGDHNLLSDFIRFMATGEASPSITPIDVSVESHLLAFAAEHSRVTHQTVDMSTYRQHGEC
ncbi:MAG: Gfo/Idh/MocA family protein [Cellulosilyticaceae bacterium]